MSQVWNLDSDQMDMKSRDQLIEQYKLFVDMADRANSRRDISNLVFVVINGLIALAIGYGAQQGLIGTTGYRSLILGLMLMLQCVFWWQIVVSYKLLGRTRKKVISELENRLPANPHCIDDGENSIGGAMLAKLLNFIETFAPLAFILFYLDLFIL